LVSGFLPEKPAASELRRVNCSLLRDAARRGSAVKSDCYFDALKGRGWSAIVSAAA
jgi:hypothetical protein